MAVFPLPGWFKKQRAKRRARVVAASSTALQVLYLYAGQPKHFDRWFGAYVPDPDRRELYSHVYERLFAWLAFFAIPAGIVKVVLREDLSDNGWKLGKPWRGIPLLAVGLPLAAFGAYYAAGQEEFQKEYPLSETARRGGMDLFLYELSNFQYYVGWEFFYRGYLQKGLEEEFGVEGATAFQTLASTLMHIGKPRDETVGAMLGGPMFGWMARFTDSVYYPLILHWWLGLATDIFCLIRSGQMENPLASSPAVPVPVEGRRVEPVPQAAAPLAPAASKSKPSRAPAPKKRAAVRKKETAK